MSTCRSCGAPIRWVETEHGKRMPIDPDPHPQGNVIPWGWDENGAKVVARVLTEPPIGRDAWRSHFTTCPHATTHRRTP